MRAKTFLCHVTAGACLTALSGCGGGLILNNEIWSESVVAILGGTIMATQNNGEVAWQFPRHDSTWRQLGRWLDPIQEAHAAASACQDVTTASCDVSGVLTMYYDNCLSGTMTNPGYRRSYVHIVFPSQADCNLVGANPTGFDAAAIAGLTGKTITRHYGEGQSQNTDHQNYILTSDNVGMGVYTIFPSGFTGDDREGGIDVTFVDATHRRISVSGMHVIALTETGAQYSNAGDFDLDAVLTAAASTATKPWDHTLNTVKSGDVPYTSGPAFSTVTNGLAFASEDASDTPAAPADGDAIVEGYGAGTKVKAGATMRTQFNLTKSVAVSIVTEDLVWSSATCCWPTSGKIHTEYDRFFVGGGFMPWPYEDLEFGPDCGKVNYTTSEGDTGLTDLHQCF